MKTPILYIFAGLPGSGKSTLAKMLAAHTQATFLRIDTIEQGLRDLCDYKVNGEGYRLTYRIAADNLNLGTSVIADSCNPWELTRNEWRKVAIDCEVKYIDIEIICSDKNEHRDRVEKRNSEVKNLKLPSWQDVLDREYHDWSSNRLVVDTAGISQKEAFNILLEGLNTPKFETNPTP